MPTNLTATFFTKKLTSINQKKLKLRGSQLKAAKTHCLTFYESRNKSDRGGSDTASSELDLFDFSDEYELGSESSYSDCLSSPNVEDASQGKMGFDDRLPTTVNGSGGPCSFQISKFGFSGYSNPKINIIGSTRYIIYDIF